VTLVPPFPLERDQADGHEKAIDLSTSSY